MKGTWEIIPWQILVVKFQKCFCLGMPSKESPIYWHALSLQSVGSNEKDNWPRGFLGKKGALSAKILEKLIRILNEQIFYCHYLRLPRKGDNLTLIAYQRNGGRLWPMNVWDTGWTFRCRRKRVKQIIILWMYMWWKQLKNVFKIKLILYVCACTCNFFIGLAGTSFRIMKYKLYSPIPRALIIARSTVNVPIILWV